MRFIDWNGSGSIDPSDIATSIAVDQSTESVDPFSDEPPKGNDPGNDPGDDSGNGPGNGPFASTHSGCLTALITCLTLPILALTFFLIC